MNWDAAYGTHSVRAARACCVQAVATPMRVLWVQANWKLLLAAQYLRHTGFGPTVTFAKVAQAGLPTGQPEQTDSVRGCA